MVPHLEGVFSSGRSRGCDKPAQWALALILSVPNRIWRPSRVSAGPRREESQKIRTLRRQLRTVPHQESSGSSSAAIKGSSLYPKLLTRTFVGLALAALLAFPACVDTTTIRQPRHPNGCLMHYHDAQRLQQLLSTFDDSNIECEVGWAHPSARACDVRRKNYLQIWVRCFYPRATIRHPRTGSFRRREIWYPNPHASARPTQTYFVSVLSKDCYS